MKKLKRKECAVLPLVLTSRWYAMIECGAKREEYRADTPYWNKRISNWCEKSIDLDPHGDGEAVVEFRLGYAKDAPRMAFRATGLRGPDCRNHCHVEWGEPAAPHWAIELGARVQLEGGAE